jgi:hypothetical protein
MMRLAKAGPVVALTAFFVVTGLRGLDFGHHWDEEKYQIAPVRDMVATGVLLPPAGIYPSLAKWLVLLPALPYGAKALVKKGSTPRTVQTAMLSTVQARGYLLAVRRVFVFVSALAIVWVYCAALAFGRGRWEALVAAAGLGLSWEYAYHARWVATDCILVQFAALTLFMLALFHKSGKPGWLYAAAVAAGLGTGSKYQGVLLLVPVLAAGAATLPRWPPGAQLRRAALLCGLAFAAYIVVSPATLLDPFTFYEKAKWIADYYRHTHHAKHWVTGPWQHWKIVLLYFGLAYFSPFRPFALVMFAACIVGAVLWVRSDRRAGIVLVSFPIVYLGYVCTTNVVVIVRNYLVVAPFLALFAARAVGEAVERLRWRWARRALAAALVLAFVVQAVWLARAAESIRHDDLVADVRQAIAYVRAHPKSSFRLSVRVQALASQDRIPMPPNVSDAPDVQKVVFFVSAEGPGPPYIQANDPWQIEAVFGPREINVDWYPDWMGNDRVVVMPLAKAIATGVPFVSPPGAKPGDVSGK